MNKPSILFSRRQFIGSLACLPLANVALASRARQLSFYHTHTAKNIQLTYHDGHHYIPSALEQLNQFLSDFRTGEIHPIDKNLLDALFVLQQKSGSKHHFEVISAYRSAKTNTQLRNKSSGVAKRSLHMQGKAIDIRLKGVNTQQLCSLAKSMKIGGVGYYKRSDFIHIDTGRVRYW